MTNDIALFRSFGLATPASFSYSQPMNALIGNGYTSTIGNTYFNAVRFVEGLLIKEDVGVGYSATFLNGIQIYDLHTKTLLAEKKYPMYGGAFYSKDLVKRLTSNLLEDLILEEAKKQHRLLNQSEVKNALSRLVASAFEKNQVQELQKSVKAIGF